MCIGNARSPPTRVLASATLAVFIELSGLLLVVALAVETEIVEDASVG